MHFAVYSLAAAVASWVEIPAAMAASAANSGAEVLAARPLGLVLSHPASPAAHALAIRIAEKEMRIKS